MKLKDIVHGVKDACEETKIHPNDNHIFECSVRIFNRMGLGLNATNDKSTSEDKKPTEKQLTTLKKFKIKYPENLTREEAKVLIGKKIDSFKS